VTTVTSPITNTSLYNPTSVSLAADVVPGDQAVTKVEFLVDGTKVGEDATAPYTFTWNSPAYGTHEISARAIDAGGSIGLSASVTVTVNVPGVAGFRGEYYDNLDFTHLLFVRADAAIDFNFGTGAPDPRMGADTFSIRWSGRIRPRYTESYTLSTITDDGVRLWVNGQLVIDQWIGQGATRYSTLIPMVANQEYDVVMEYYDQGSTASAQLLWSSASQVEEPIPASRTTVPVPPNSIPNVWLTAPTVNSPFLPIDDIPINANATDLDGSIARVEFWADGSKLGEKTAAPYSWTWPGPHSKGSHTVSAIAFDNGNASSVAQATVQLLPLILNPMSARRLTNPDRMACTIQTTLPSGRTYVIEWSSDLTTWQSLRSGTSDGTQITVTDEAPDVTQRFYRMRVTN
jgi:hypothetical protein